MQEIHCLMPRSHEEAQQILAGRRWLLRSEPEKAEQGWYTDEVPRQSAAPQLCFSRGGEGSALSASCSHPRLVTGLFCVRKRCSGWIQVSAGRGNEGLAFVLLLTQPQHVPSLIHRQFHLRGHVRRTSSAPRGASCAPPRQQTAKQKRVLGKLCGLRPGQQGRLGTWGEKTPRIIRRKVRNTFATPRLTAGGGGVRHTAGKEQEETRNDPRSRFQESQGGAVKGLAEDVCGTAASSSSESSRRGAAGAAPSRGWPHVALPRFPWVTPAWQRWLGHIASCSVPWGFVDALSAPVCTRRAALPVRGVCQHDDLPGPGSGSSQLTAPSSSWARSGQC